MSNPQEPAESSFQDTQDTPEMPSANPASTPSSEQTSQVQQQASNIVNEVLDDITNRKDIDVIIGTVACILAILFFLMQITIRSGNFANLRLFFTLSVFTPALSGWALRAGYGAVGRARVKLFALGGFAFGIYLVAVF